jgi:hypothetical protein
MLEFEHVNIKLLRWTEGFLKWKICALLALAQRINYLQCGIKIDDIFLSILLYADDIALIAPDELKLQQMTPLF